MRGIDMRLNVHASSFASKGFTGCLSLPLSILIEVLSVKEKSCSWERSDRVKAVSDVAPSPPIALVVSFASGKVQSIEWPKFN
jgi:hypothetical protein